jgi:hypothetical protein
MIEIQKEEVAFRDRAVEFEKHTHFSLNKQTRILEEVMTVLEKIREGGEGEVHFL